MDNVKEFIDSTLKHASRYDPQKAHEYYLRTRELKGRRSTKDLTEPQKEGWAYTKTKVQEERKGAMVLESQKNRDSVAQLRETIRTRREEIRQKLQQIMARINKESETNRDQISDEVKSKIDALPKAPEGLTKEQAAEFAAKRREEIAKIRGEAEDKRVNLSTTTKAQRTNEKESATAERTQLTADLKASLEKAKQTYQEGRDKIKAKYESELDREFNSIRDNV